MHTTDKPAVILNKIAGIEAAETAQDFLALFRPGTSWKKATKYDRRRAEISSFWKLTNYRGDGLNGCIMELWSVSPNSRKESVSTQGKPDVQVYYMTHNGMRTHAPLEIKTMGGRVGGLYGKGDKALMVYVGAWCHYVTQPDRTLKLYKDYFEPVLIPVNLFLRKAEELGGLKNTNGTNPEMAVKTDSKRFMGWLKDYPVKWNGGGLMSAEAMDALWAMAEDM